MIFASDLDKTLIYTKKYVNLPDDEVEVIQTRDNKPLIHISKPAITKLEEINKNCTFIPTTTRTLTEYSQIELMKRIKPQHLIACNGAHIFVDGLLDTSWLTKVKTTIANTAAEMEEVKQKLWKTCGTEWIVKHRAGDDIFFYFNIDRNALADSDFMVFKEWANERGWTAFMQDRKLYFMPTCVDKVHALGRLQDVLEKKIDIAAGDSLMDLKMLQMVETSITPRHGEIVELGFESGMHVTENEGLASSEEILDFVISKL